MGQLNNKQKKGKNQIKFHRLNISLTFADKL